MNDISNVIHNCQFHLYADDTQLYLKTKVDLAIETILSINDDLARIADFSTRSFLKINSDKSKFIVIGSKNNLNKLSRIKNIALAEIIMNNVAIERVYDARNLGITFDQYLNWHSHINGLISSAYYRLKLAYRYSKFLSQDSKLRVVESYILSLFNYGCPVLQNLTSEMCNKIQKVQNSCVRYITNTRKYDHISPSFNKLKMLKMSDRRDMQSLTIVHNIINDRAPGYLIDKVQFNYTFHGHNTRIRDSIRIPKSRTNFGYNKFFRKYCEMYNNIKRTINFKNNISTATFKFKLKKYFLNLRYPGQP